jgi:hypothetical protein
MRGDKLPLIVYDTLFMNGWFVMSPEDRVMNIRPRSFKECAEHTKDECGYPFSVLHELKYTTVANDTDLVMAVLRFQ